jgi:hypothetical protein
VLDDQLRDVESAVRALASERFPDAEIVTIDVTDDLNFEDDEILRVRIVFRTPEKRLDAKKTSGFVRHLRPRLSELGLGSLFPIMSFVSADDYGELQA